MNTVMPELMLASGSTYALSVHIRACGIRWQTRWTQPELHTVATGAAVPGESERPASCPDFRAGMFMLPVDEYLPLATSVFNSTEVHSFYKKEALNLLVPVSLGPQRQDLIDGRRQQ